MGILLTSNVIPRFLHEEKQANRPLGLHGHYGGSFRFLKPHEMHPLKANMIAPGNFVGPLAGNFGGRFPKPQLLHYMDMVNRADVKACLPFIATIHYWAIMNALAPNSPSMVNPEAESFVPASQTTGNPGRGLATIEEFMESHRAWMAKGGFNGMKHDDPVTETVEAPAPVKARELPARVLLFKDVPDWMSISDAFGLIYGGAVDCVFRSNMAEITVQFCDEATCNAYLEAHGTGITLSNPGNPDDKVVIKVEKAPRGEDISPALQVKITAGGSRLVRVNGMLNAEKSLELTTRAMEYDVDHYDISPEKTKADFAYFFFCGIVDGWTFKQKLEENEGWAGYTVAFVADPCKVATSFHGNNVPNRLAAAAAAV